MSNKEIVGKFAVVNTDAYEKYELPLGSTVFISGSGFAPVDEDDNYRLCFIVLSMDGALPSRKQALTVNRKDLDVVSDELDAELKKNMEAALDAEASAAVEAANDTE